MDKIIRIFFLSLICSIALPMHAQVPQNDVPFIKRHYRKFIADLKTIKKCYFSKSKCDQEEKKQAQRTLRRLSTTGLILIGALTALVVGGKVISQLPEKQRVLLAYIQMYRKQQGLLANIQKKLPPGSTVDLMPNIDDVTFNLTYTVPPGEEENIVNINESIKQLVYLYNQDEVNEIKQIVPHFTKKVWK